MPFGSICTIIIIIIYHLCEVYYYLCRKVKLLLFDVVCGAHTMIVSHSIHCKMKLVHNFPIVKCVWKCAGGNGCQIPSIWLYLWECRNWCCVNRNWIDSLLPHTHHSQHMHTTLRRFRFGTISIRAHSMYTNHITFIYFTLHFDTHWC